MLHKNVPASGRHPVHAFEYANTAARLAATGLVASDVTKVALQQDTNALYILTNHSPVTWVAVSGDAGSPDWSGIQNKPATFPPDVHGHDQYALKVGMVAGQTTLAYDEGTRTVTLTGTDFDVFSGGTNYTKNTVSLAHPDVQGGHFFYYDETGTLVTGQTPWDLTIHAPVSFVFWDATNNRGIPFEERHNAGRDVYWHRNQHINEGTKISSGFAASGYTINLQSDAGVSLAIATGRVEDEDIRVDTTPLPDAGPYTIIERVGTSGDWQITRTSALPFLYTGTNLQYNQNNGGTWQRTNVSNTDYTNIWVFAATALNGQDQYIFVPGQAEFGTANLANADVVSNVSWGNLPFQEIAPLYRLTYQFGNGYAGTARCRLTEIVRVIGTFASVTQATASDHGSQTGLADDDHTQYALADGTRGAFAKVGTAQSWTAEQTFKELKDTVFTITDAAAFEIDPANGSVQVVTLGAARTPAATNFEAGQTVLLGIDDGTAYSITWTTVNPTWVKAGGTASAPTLAATGYTWILLWKVGNVIYSGEVGQP